MHTYSKAAPGEMKRLPLGATYCAAECRRDPGHVWLGQDRATIVELDVASGEVVATHTNIDSRGTKETPPGKPADRAITCIADRGDGALVFSTKRNICLVAIDGGLPIELPQCPHLFVVEKLFGVGPSIFAQGLARDGRGGSGLAPGVTGWETAFAQPKRLTTPEGHFVNDIVFDQAKSKAFGVFSPTPHSVSLGAWDITAGGLVWSKDLPDGIPLPLLAVVPSPDDVVDWDPPPAKIGLSADRIVIFRQLTDAPAVAVVDRESFAVTAVVLKDTDGTTPSALQFMPMADVPHAFVLTGGELRVASLVTGAIAPPVLEEMRPFDLWEARAAMGPFPLGDGFVAPYRKELLVKPSVFHPLFGMAGLEELRRAHEIAIHPETQGPIVLSERGRQAIGIDI